MICVTKKPYSRKAIYQTTKTTGLGDIWKPSQLVSYSPYNKLYERGSKILKVSVNYALQGTEATKRGLRESFVDDVSISRTRALPQQQDLNKSLISPADRKAAPAVISEEEEDILDWDFYLENPPLKPASTIELEFEYAGRSQPIPVSDPWDE